VFTGPPWGEGVVGTREATEAQWQATLDNLRDFCDHAAKQNVELCLECHAGGLAEDTPFTLRLLRGVDRPNLTVNLQLPLLDDDWRTSLREPGQYTTHVHMHNWTERLGEGDRTFLADGTFDWEPVRTDSLQFAEHRGHSCRSGMNRYF